MPPSAPAKRRVVDYQAFQAFVGAQQLEAEDSLDAARAAYDGLVKAARAAHKTLKYDEAAEEDAERDEVPDAGLVVSVALNSLGGLHLDAGQLSKARTAFEESLVVWPGNSMALVKPQVRHKPDD